LHSVAPSAVVVELVAHLACEPHVRGLELGFAPAGSPAGVRRLAGRRITGRFAPQARLWHSGRATSPCSNPSWPEHVRPRAACPGCIGPVCDQSGLAARERHRLNHAFQLAAIAAR
jgi:hypothetical protein